MTGMGKSWIEQIPPVGRQGLSEASRGGLTVSLVREWFADAMRGKIPPEQSTARLVRVLWDLKQRPTGRENEAAAQFYLSLRVPKAREALRDVILLLPPIVEAYRLGDRDETERLARFCDEATWVTEIIGQPAGPGRPAGALWQIQAAVIAPVVLEATRAAGRKARGWGNSDGPVVKVTCEALNWLKQHQRLVYLPSNLAIAIADTLKKRSAKPGA
jgi:hypothetical protein